MGIWTFGLIVDVPFYCVICFIGRINLDNDEPDAVEMEMHQVMEEEKLKCVDVT